jgi:hypothetical protein
MNKRRLIICCASLLLLAASVAAYAQINRPYRHGSVWSMAFIRVKPGADAVYLTFVATDLKRMREELKKDGVLVSYKVLTTEAHDQSDWNLIFMDEYKDLATMEATQAKQEAVEQRFLGNDQQLLQKYKDLSELRERVGDRIAREIILEPQK